LSTILLLLYVVMWLLKVISSATMMVTALGNRVGWSASLWLVEAGYEENLGYESFASNQSTPKADM
jgi:hypothetical protein